MSPAHADLRSAAGRNWDSSEPFHLAFNLYNILLVGLPDKAVKESSERVHAALYASGLSLPPKRITVNLAPADLPKEGSHYDLPIALGADGGDRRHPVRCARGLPRARRARRSMARSRPRPACCRRRSRRMGATSGSSVRRSPGSEAAWAAEDLNIIAAQSLLAVVNHLGGYQLAARPTAETAQRSGRACPTSAKSAGRRSRGVRSKSRRRAATTS